MSILKYKYSQFEAAKSKLDDINDRLDDIIDLTMKANETFVLVQMGEWAQAQADACVQVETDARIFRKAMGDFQRKFGNVLVDAKQIQFERDQFISELGASVADSDRVVCDTSGQIPSRCATLTGYLIALDSKASDAEGALAGLRDSGHIAAAISSVKNDVTTEKSTVEDVLTAWRTFRDSASDFESSYSCADNFSTNSLRSGFFITPTMLNSVGAELVSAYENSDVAKGLENMSNSAKSLGKLKKLIEKYAKPLSEFKHYEDAGAFFGAMSQVIKQNGFGNFVKGLFGAGSGGNKLATASIAYKFSNSPFSWKKLGSWNGFSLKNIRHKFFEDTVGSISKAAKDMREGFSGFSDIGGYLKSKFFKGGAGELLDDAPKMSTGLSKTAKFFKGAAKGLGVVGDVATLYGVFTNSKAAYQTTVGDDAQKTAAAIVEGGKGLLDFGAGKAVGAIVGTCFGGPVGTVVGMAIGGAVGGLISSAIENWDTSGLVDGLGNLLRGGKKNAFAAG